MFLRTLYITEEQFDWFIALPENADQNFELIAGGIIEVVSNSLFSHFAAKILGRINAA
jgi:hypothetical protein